MQNTHKPSNSELHSQQPKSDFLLSAFCQYPRGARFNSMDDEETIVLLLRRHPITNLPWIIIGAILTFLPAIVNSFVPVLTIIPASFYLVGLLGWYLITLAYVFESFLNWFFNVYIVTDERIIDVDFLNLIYRQISYAKIDQIQDVTSQMGGVVRTIFNYGNVNIQTAAEVAEFEFSAVPEPDRVVKLINELQMEEEQEKLEGRAR